MIKKDNGHTDNGVTMSLLELLITAKKVKIREIWALFFKENHRASNFDQGSINEMEEVIDRDRQS